MSRRRRLERLLEAIMLFSQRIGREKVEVSFIGGKTNEILFLEKKTKAFGIDDIITFWGSLDRIEVYRQIVSHHIGLSYIPDDKIFTTASPTKLMEYLSLGLPVVGTDSVVEQKNILIKTKAGLLAKDDAKDIADTLYI